MKRQTVPPEERVVRGRNWQRAPLMLLAALALLAGLWAGLLRLAGSFRLCHWLSRPIMAP